MRDSFVLIMSLLLITVCANLDNDGFNLYKDHLRGRVDEPLELDPEIERRMLYFYRAPLRFYVGHLPGSPQVYRKRTANVFKHYMLNKDVFATQKRTSKAALSLMLQSKQDPDQEKENYCLYGK